VVRF